jgi:hypothetical protein
VGALIPATWVRSGHGIPDLCSRHGERPTRRRRIVIESSPPGWTYATIPAGLLIFGILRAVFRKAIVAPAWPFCDRCRRRRAVAIATAGGVVGAGLVVAVIGFQSPSDNVTVELLALGLAIVLAGYAGFHWARPAVVAGTTLTRDGLYVLLKRANPLFAAQLRPPPGGGDRA